MSKRRLLYIALAGYLLALLVTLPASLFEAPLNRLHPQLRLHGLEGSIWHGRITQLQYGQHRFADVQWRLQPLMLLLGRLQLGLDYSERDNHLYLELAKGVGPELQLHNIDASLSLGWLQSLTPYSFPKLGGTLLIDGLDAELLGRRPQQASGAIQWQDATLDMGQRLKLGSWSLQLQEGEAGIEGRLSEASGLLSGESKLELSAEGRYRIDASFTPTAKGQSLGPQLSLFMRKNPDGSYSRQLQGQLP